jgi:PAS domain S-box-containing protein
MTELTNSRISAFFRSLSKGAALFAVGVGWVVLAGWLAGNEFLKRIFPGLVAMNPATALGFILAGASLYWSYDKRDLAAGKVRRRIGVFSACAVMMVGAVKLAGCLFGWKIGFDQMLFPGQLLEPGASFPNRMAPNTALNFFLLGLGLLLVNVETKRGRRPSQYLAVATGLLSWLALIGYAYGAKLFYGLSSYIPMALHTALSFHILSIGLLCSRPDVGLMTLLTGLGTGSRMIRRVLPAAVLIPSVLGWLRLQGQQLKFYNAEMGVSLMVVLIILLFGMVLWWNAASLNQLDRQRDQFVAELNRFFTLALDMLCIAGMDGFFRRLNPAFGEILGYDVRELLARPFLDFVHPEDRAGTLAEVEKLSAGRSVIRFENRYRCKDGSYKWLAWKSVPIPETRAIYATARDITDQKMAEREIQELNGNLRKRALELESANKELESFSYSVSHDLRAPVRHIDSFARLLEKSAGERMDAKSRRLLENIVDSAKEMGQLIDELLLFSRMGRAAMRREPVDLEKAVREALHSLEEETANRQIVWKRSALPSVQGDSPLLKQVLINLISNAVKYTRTRDPAVIEIDCCEDQAAEWIISVRDNGVGFDMQYGHKLFGVFQRLHRAEDFEGTGVGLANVRRIIARHGGRTWAEGQVEKGATFFFSLPKHGSATP